MSAITSPLQVLRLNEVRRLTGLSRSHVYRLEAAGDFPRRIKLSTRASAWIASEIEGWLAGRIATRDRQEVAS